uniref:Uncharacterized protein n=1 Tax=Oryza meridionalis TaxID=40149 RepID=A0A0E0D2T5_9ORYZ
MEHHGRRSASIVFNFGHRRHDRILLRWSQMHANLEILEEFVLLTETNLGAAASRVRYGVLASVGRRWDHGNR